MGLDKASYSVGLLVCIMCVRSCVHAWCGISGTLIGRPEWCLSGLQGAA